MFPHQPLVHSLFLLDLSQLTDCEQIATAMHVERKQSKRKRDMVQKHQITLVGKASSDLGAVLQQPHQHAVLAVLPTRKHGQHLDFALLNEGQLKFMRLKAPIASNSRKHIGHQPLSSVKTKIRGNA